MDVWGPHQGEMSEKVDAAIRAANVYHQVTLVGAGSGINYGPDALQKYGRNVQPALCDWSTL